MKMCFDCIIGVNTHTGEQKCLKKMAHMIETLSMCELHGDFSTQTIYHGHKRLPIFQNDKR